MLGPVLLLWVSLFEQRLCQMDPEVTANLSHSEILWFVTISPGAEDLKCCYGTSPGSWGQLQLYGERQTSGRKAWAVSEFHGQHSTMFNQH